MTLLLRAAAVAIAIAALVDPVLTRAAAVPRALVITIIDTPSLDLPGDGRDTRRQVAWSTAAEIRAALEDAFEVRTRELADGDPVAACPRDAACVLISDGAAPARIGDTPPVLGAVRIGEPLTPNVGIRLLQASRVHPLALGQVTVHADAEGVAGQRTTVQIFDGSMLIGEASHQWRSDAGTQQASIPVTFTPRGSGLRSVRVRLSPVPGEITALDNEAEIAVDVSAARARVLVYEPRPTWPVTFLRRALEADPRFEVAGHVRVAPGVSVVAGSHMRLDATALTDTAVVIVGAPETLPAADVNHLERFVRVRGGSLIVVPDTPIAGPIARLVPVEAIERRGATPQSVGPLRASELLLFSPPPVASTALATANGQPVIIALPTGNGRIVVSGALDAWRHRAADEGFAQFWNALVADAAAAADGDFDVTVVRAPRPSGVRGLAIVSWRSVDPSPAPVTVSATVRCEGQTSQTLRPWPAAAGRFEAEIPPLSEGDCEIHAALTEPVTRSAVAGFRVARSPDGYPREDELESAVRAHGGLVFSRDQVSEFANQVRSRMSRDVTSVAVYPMRSPWWIVPFAGCLAVEWWRRRRRGLN